MSTPSLKSRRHFVTGREAVRSVPGLSVPFLLASILILLTAAAELRAQSSRMADPSAGVTRAIEKSDQLFIRERYDEARRVLEQLHVENPGDAETLWRLAQHAINDGDGTSNSTEQERYFREAVRYAEAAVRADGRNANAWAYLAASHGSYAMYAGGKEKVKLANKIRDELDRALELDPQNQVAHTIYGTWHREVAEVGWIERQLANMFLGSMPDGSIDASIRHFKAAIRQGPDVLRHHFELGLTYIAADREAAAAAAFHTAQKCANGWKSDNLRRKIMKKWLRENG